MKPGIKQVLGKTISGVVIAENDDRPKMQMFLIFTDGSQLEFYSDDDFTCANDLDHGGITRSIRYIESNANNLRKISVITQEEEISCTEDEKVTPKERKKLFVKSYQLFRDKLVLKGLLPKQPTKH
jgi:hypothetical protein